MPPRKTPKHEDLKNVFGRKLRQLRKDRGIGLQELAAKLGAKGWDVGEIGLSHLEGGRRTMTDTELVLILRTIKAKLSDLE